MSTNPELLTLLGLPPTEKKVKKAKPAKAGGPHRSEGIVPKEKGTGVIARAYHPRFNDLAPRPIPYQRDAAETRANDVARELEKARATIRQERAIARFFRGLVEV